MTTVGKKCLKKVSKRQRRSGALTCFSNFAIEKKGGRGAERLHVSAILSYVAFDVVLICDRRFILHPVPTVCIAIESM